MSGVIRCTFRDLNLDVTLSCGQAFRWKKNEQCEWVSTFGGRVWCLWQSDAGDIHYRVLNAVGSPPELENSPEGGRRRKHRRVEKPPEDENKNLLKDYFQLGVDLRTMSNEWRQTDPTFQALVAARPKMQGIRVLRQEPLETLMAFICSSNNNIARISSMVEKLCIMYGTEIYHGIEGQFYAFPTLEQLNRDGVEAELREAGFGYRAKYVCGTAKMLAMESDQWLNDLRAIPYREAHRRLMQLPGVGAKVADCVCLMALDKPEAVPVDIHMWRMATQHYLPHLKSVKNLSPAVYREIGDFFRTHFGKHAGWAQSVLFTLDLKQHRKFGGY